MVKLGVNIDHVATIRNARGGIDPEPVTAAALSELGGADSITIHLREDRRHINERDLHLIRETSALPLNLEMACTNDITEIARQILPDMCTLVPEKRQELTTEGGLDVANNFDVIKKTVGLLMDKGIVVSLFIDPDEAQIEMSAKTGATFVEFHTGAYADSKGIAQRDELNKLFIAADQAQTLELTVNAGHGLNYRNINSVINMNGLHEVNIGHSIIARAIYIGLPQAVREMKELLNQNKK